MKIRDIKIGRRLLLGFGVILMIILGMGAFSVYYMNKVSVDTKNLFEHPYVVSNAVREIKINILNIRRFMLDIPYAKADTEIERYQAQIDAEESLAFKNYDIVFNAYLGDTADIGRSYRLLKQWKPIRDEAFNQIRTGNREKGNHFIIYENRPFVDSLFRQIEYLVDFASIKAQDFYSNLKTSESKNAKTQLYLFCLVLILSLLIAMLLTRSITRPLGVLVDNINKIAYGQLDNPELPEGKDEIGLLGSSYNLMQHNLMQKVTVAENIAHGNFSTQVPSYGPNDALANAINLISDNFNLVINQAKKVALGDYSSNLEDTSNSNQLIKVINQMFSSLKEVVTNANRIAKGDYTGNILPKSASDELAHSLNKMMDALRNSTEENYRQTRLKTAQNDLNEKMRGDLDISTLAKNIVTFVSKFTGSQLGALYIFDEDENLYKLQASYAFTFRKGLHSAFKPGESLVGQAALEKEIISFSQVPENYTNIVSGLGETLPKHIIVAPFVYNKNVLGVIECGSVNEFSPETYEFLRSVLENIAIAIFSSQNRDKMVKLLNVTKEQAEELQVQQEELRQTNEELEAQTIALKKSEEYLQTQQEELRVTNEELEEKTRNLEKQKDRIEEQNRILENATREIEQKAKELEITNKYKSEFLANMSHELRTPLNSLLLLSQMLADNKGGNLLPEQLESARIINKSGKDLLTLINDILDLSKIESGKMNFEFTSIKIDEITRSLQSYFLEIAHQKGLEFKITKDPKVSDSIVTDEQKLHQILRNLIANAIKFTEKGKVELKIYSPSENENLSRSGLNPKETIAFSVKDTGIGISENKQLEIFEAFQQADGSISRKYGGTGLGLSITRELTKMFGGEIKLYSKTGEGSEFIVFLPVSNNHFENQLADSKEEKKEQKTSVKSNSITDSTEIVNTIKKGADTKTFFVPSIDDDRNNLGPNDQSMLIIDDDRSFAEILARMCRQKGFKCLATATGEEGLELAKKYIPKGILLDINLPGIDGWEVLNQLKNSADTRHIPVHVISGYEETLDAYSQGAIGYLTKPVTQEKLEQTFEGMKKFISKKMKDLLIVEDDDNLRKSIKILLGNTGIKITECNSGIEALDLLKKKMFDCMVLDLGLPDMNGFELLKKSRNLEYKIPPVVVYTGKELTKEENDELEKYTQTIIIKGVKSDERLLDETALFLHRVVDEMPERQKKMIINLYDKEQMFREKNILIVDDDMRNVFALTQILEASKMKVIIAQNGKKALEMLDHNTNIQLILMDIMMPVMDGYETMRAIRSDKRFEDVPIIALTAKAMKEDREKCIAAGANDYLAKPVDIEKLFNLMRIWLYK